MAQDKENKILKAGFCNIKLIVEYDGANYVGWQHQKNGISIQETLQKAIEKVVNEKIMLNGSGRTDSGVHALGQVANFKTKSTIPVKKLVLAINYYLPKDIVVKSIKKVPMKFHSRYSAKSKVYRYTFLNSNVGTALDRNFCFTYNVNLNIEKMRKASKLIIGTHDFNVFKSKSNSNVENTIRTIMVLNIKKKGKYIIFTIEGNGFLYKMVRSIVGTLLEVGKGKMTIKEFKSIFKSKTRSLAGDTVPAKGLCLMKVKY